MPEIKNSFLQGKMNKDLDERLVPNGQYRHAKNIEVSTAEDSNIGTVKNILGNHRVDHFDISAGFKCVGSIADEKTNKLYWFISSYDKDIILEYDTANDVALPVLVDLNAGNYKAVLKFSGNIITGVNIIDELLFWTDNNSEPKKINIRTCKAGTDASGNYHTQLKFKNGSFSGITAELVSPSPLPTFDPATDNIKYSDYGKYFWAEQKQIEKLFPPEIIDSTGTTIPFTYDASEFNAQNPYNVRHYRNGKFLGIKQVTAQGVDRDTGVATNPFGNTIKSHEDDFQIGDVVFGNNIDMDIEERHIMVIKPKPLNAPAITINHSLNPDSKNKIPNLFETKLPRFSYRYKFADGEYSAFAPFTVPVFNPKYQKDESTSSENTFYNKDNAYDIKEPYNKAMVNSIHSVELTDFVSAKTPEDAVEIEILYKQEESSVIYSIGTIRHVDPEWHSTSNHENLGNGIGIGKAGFPRAFQAEGGYTKGRYIVTTENIYAALPANQLLRPWDNVPKKALAQEITGNRIVYGNYVQNYDLNYKVEVSVNYSDRSNPFSNFESQGLPSVKSQRNYKLGVVYCDKHGRETPVFTSDQAALNIPWQDNDGTKNASKSLQLNVSTPTSFPEWVDSLKFFIKENSNQYYNLLMERAWVTKSTYELDNSEGHMWLCFPSSDRNKISEEDYIILKKKIGTGEEQVRFENKYKVIDIKNEAPDAIKYQLVNYGVATNHTNDRFTQVVGTQDPLFPDPNARIDFSSSNKQFRGTSEIVINKSFWLNNQERRMPLHLQEGLDTGSSTKKPIQDDLYISWFRGKDNGAGDYAMSKRYKVIGGWIGTTGYVLRLSTPIAKIDADIAHVKGDSSTTESDLYQDLLFQVEKRILKDQEDFSGKFFVKISKNQITDLIESGNPVSILDKFQVKSKTSLWYWQDDIANNSPGVVNYNTSSSGYGLTNYNGEPISYTDLKNHLHYVNATDMNNGWGDTAGDGASANGEMRVTDFATPWKNMRDDTFGPTFFIDSMHMVAGQSSAGNYAKYSCVTWSGATAGDVSSAEDSSWSYPPLKTWISDFGSITDLITTKRKKLTGNFSKISKIVRNFSTEKLPIWRNNNLISTNSQLPENPDYEDLKIDGWIGPLQNVSRNTPATSLSLLNNHVNGLEGFVTTVENHSKGPRRWFDGITGSKTDYGVGTDTKTYADNHEDVGRHFMHLSFFAPGKDLHDGRWGGDSSNPTINDFSPSDATHMIYGKDSFAAKLQGIWGGGVFTGESQNEKFGTNANSDNNFLHMPMEGNYDEDLNYLPETPGPGVGFGYDLKYKELHERQWDPTFNKDGDTNNEIRDFIRNLYPGSKFRFNKVTTGSVDGLIDDTVYTIKKVQIKKLYNHTSWRKPYNRFIDTTYKYNPVNGTEDEVYQSVEEAALTWLDSVDVLGSDPDGSDALSGAYGKTTGLIHKITDFGASHNRRVCYIIELDKNPADSNSAMGNPLNGNFISGGNNAPHDAFCADYHSDNFTDIEFLDPVQDHLLTDLSKFPAIWELDPKKQEVDLDIYYEASSNIPVNINKDTNELFAPIGCKVEIVDSPTTSVSTVLSWDNHTVTLDPGFPQGAGGQEIDYSGRSFKFIRQDGGYTVAEAGQQDLTGASTGLRTEIVFREDIGEVISSGLSWNNCFSFGNGIESNRIKDDFNEPFITNGVKASTTIQEAYQEERRKNGLIYSGIYNSNSGINDLNQFVMAEKITKDLNPTYGSIQKLFSRNTDLVTFCEDKVVKVLANKDAVFNADGNPQLTANENVLGQTIPFIGEYGIATNPESFASESYRAYFTDKQRGAVLRLSKDGLTPISDAGMSDWFRDNLPQYHSLIGTYDSYKENYNLTLSNIPEFSENFILDSYLETGEALENFTLGSLSRVTNPGVSDGNTLEYLYETYRVNEYNNPGNVFNWSSFNQVSYDLTATISVIHHAEIPYESLQQYYSEILPGTGSQLEQWTATATNVQTGQVHTHVAQSEQAAIDYFNNYVGASFTGIQTTQFTPATYSSTLPDSGSGGSGRFWYASFRTYPKDIWGNSGNTIKSLDPHIWGDIRRHHGGNFSVVNEANSSPNTAPLNYKNWDSGFDPAVEKQVVYPSVNTQAEDARKISNCITRSAGMGVGGGAAQGAVVFDRVRNNGAYIETRQTGVAPASITGNPSYTSATQSSLYGLLNQNVGPNQWYSSWLSTWFNYSTGMKHQDVFNGDEIHVEVRLLVFPTYEGGFSSALAGYNYIEPVIELRNGNSPIDPSYIYNPPSTYTLTNTYFDDYQSINSIMSNPNYGSGVNPGGGNMNNGYVQVGGLIGVVAGHATYANANDYWDSYIDYSTSPRAEFDNTNTISSLNWNNHTGSGMPAGSDAKTIILRASWKFIDPSTQNPDGTRKSGGPIPVGGVGGINDIYSKKIINNLRVRVSQKAAPTSSNFYTGQMGDSNGTDLNHPLWMVKEIKIRKGFGITADSIDPAYSQNVGATQTQQAVSGATGRAEVLAVPPVTVPAWTEVIHHNFGTGSWSYVGGSGMYVSSRLPYRFGQTYNRSLQTGLKQNPDITQPPLQTDVIEYSAPSDWNSTTGNAPNVLNTSHNNYGGNGSAHQPAGIGAHGLIFNRVNEPIIGGNNYSTTSAPALVTYNEEFFNVNPGSFQPKDITYDITGNEWQSGEWYLVDVEFDNTYGDGIPTNPGDPDLKVLHQQLTYPHTRVSVMGVGSAYATTRVNGLDVDPEHGVGVFDGTTAHIHVTLVPTKRTEYGSSDGTGDNKVVLRGIFKVDGNSSVISGVPGGAINGNSSNQFALRVYNTSNGIRINKIIAKKLSTNISSTNTIDYFKDNWLPNVGVTDNTWQYNDGSTNSNNLLHMFEQKHMYFERPGLCWQVPASYADGNYYWSQEFGLQQTQPPPTASNTGWELSFTVNNNPRTNSFSGMLEGSIAIDDGNGNTKGLYFGDIEDIGNYLIKFNFDEDMTNYNPSTVAANLPAEPWVFLRGNIGETPDTIYSSGILNTVSSMSPLPSINKMIFKDMASSLVAQEYKISDIQLLDSRQLFLGGSAGSWTFDQFNTSTNDYIYWKTATDQFPGEYLVFFNCPAVNFHNGKLGFVNVNQQITKTINQFEQYKIKFTYSISPNSNATLAIYYYNSNGYGFKINDITQLPSVGTGKYDLEGHEIRKVGFDQPLVVTIGELETSGQIKETAAWHNVNQVNPNYEADLINSFVIAVQGEETDTIDGTIDNITMQQVFLGSDIEDTTIAFSEKVNGWTSFMDFIPENGLSLSKKYFTFNQGGLYQHYVPKKGNNLGEVDNANNFIKYVAEEADNYNRFYESPSQPSSITAVLNQEPSTVKTFNTLNYEGSQAYIVEPANASDITLNNAIAYSLGYVPGWECEEIRTDLDAGTVDEFIKKEGKWFNYIKGKNNNNVPNTSLFSVQGIGFVDSIFVEVETIDMGDIGEGTTTTNGEPEIVVPINTGVEVVIENGGTTGGGGGGGTGAGGGGGGGGGY